MATITQSIADTSGFFPETWALEALNVLRRNLVLPKLITTDTDLNEKGWIGKQLNIPYPGTFTAQDKTAGNPITAQAPVGGSTVSLALSKHKVVDFLVEDYAAAQSNSDLLMRYVEPAVIALAEQVETDLWSLMTSLTGPSVGTVGTNLNAATFFNARKNLNIQKAPNGDRFAIVSTKDEVALLQDTTLQYFFANNQHEQDALLEGSSARFSGFDIFMSQFADSEADYHGVQTATITGSPTGGTFTLTYQGQTTAAIAYNATAATVLSALQALSTIGTATNAVAVSGSAGGPYTVTFGAGIPGAPVALTATASLTGGTSPGVTIADSTTLTTHNLFLHKSSMMLATRQFAEIPAGSGVATATVVDPESGLSLRVLKQYNPQYRAEYVGFDILYGFVALRPSLGLVALS